MISDQILVQTLKGKETKRPAFWFMRQAGRYLPEYRAIRQNHKNFLEFCYTPDAAVEVTLQPITRFDMDAAIIFSDILVVPHALGAKVWFEEGHGPRLEPTISKEQLDKLQKEKITEFLAPVYEALKQTRKKLAKEKSLIGFCGAPWTLACYMIQGSSSKEFGQVKQFMEGNPALLDALIDLLADAVVIHACEQIKAGADVIQLFDSWAGLLTDAQFSKYVIAPTKKIVAQIKAHHPDVPIIGFPREAGIKYLNYAQQTGVDGVSFDGTVPLEWAKNKLQPAVTVQGCLDNQLLANDRAGLLKQAQNIISELGNKAFVFNLGHGILPHTPPEHVAALSELIKSTKF